MAKKTPQETNKTNAKKIAEEHIRRRIDSILEDYFSSLTVIAPDIAAVMNMTPEEWAASQKDLHTSSDYEEMLYKRCYRLFMEEEDYINAELSKPEYGGKTRAEIEADGLTEDGQIIAESVYGKAWRAAITALNRKRCIDFETRLQPYLQEELQKPEYEGRTIEDLREEWLTDHNPACLYRRATNAADKTAWENSETYKRLAEAHTADNQQSSRPKNQLMAVDKLTAVMFADWLDMEREERGQLSMFPVKMEADNYPTELTLYFDVRYPEELPEKEKKLTPLDRRIYQSMYNLQQLNRDMTYTQIFRNAGLGETPNTRQVEQVRKSIDKMRRTTTTWDNRIEATAYNKDGTYIQYDGYLCPVEVITERKCFNGKPVEMYVRTLRPLPLMEFAKERRQVALVPNYVIALPAKVNATDINIALIDYTAKRIVRAKNEDKEKPAAKRKGSVKIIYSTLYKGIGATTRQKQRTALKNLFVYLDELKAKGFIDAYREEKTKSTGAVGVLIEYH